MMCRRSWTVALVAAATALQVETVRPQAPDDPAVDRRSTAGLLNSYCVTCHNAKLKTAGLAIDTLDLGNVARDAQLWEKVATKLRTHEMPPPGRPRPDLAGYASATTAIEAALDAAVAAHPQPGRVPVHRLNRAEYTNAIRDLLDVHIDDPALLIPDEPDQHGFDNIASLLSISTARLERYLSAARKVSRLAIGDPTVTPAVETYTVHPGLVQDERTSDDLPFGSQGGVSIDHIFPVDAEYTVKVLLKRQVYLYIIGMGERHQLDIRIDGTLVKRLSVGGEGKGMTAPEGFAGNTQGDPAWEEYMHTADSHLEVRVPVKAGRKKLGVSFVRQHWKPEGVFQPPQSGYAVVTNDYYFGAPSVESIMVGGPYAVSNATRGDSPSRRKIFTCRPTTAAGELPCATKILSTLATRAYRRPLSDADVQTLVGFYKEGRASADFDRGIQRGLERILSGPSFLFRLERTPRDARGGAPHRLSDLELASRLSFFIWSSIPDDTLLDLAARGRLKDPAEIDRQVRRMLADPRAAALADNFAMQWLKLGKLASVKPDEYAFPEFDENLRDAMQQETRQFIRSQLQDDRSIVDLIGSDYTFVNERLARHYGIPNIYGSRLRRVAFNDGVRGGLLGQASVLTVTSYPNRTSPVVRGRWLLENMLGAPPPPPPPDVPALNEEQATHAKSLRDRMEEHRRNPVCASCHVRMDPLGFALENFDGLGKFRTVSDGLPIDAEASLPDGTTFEGIAGLRTLLLKHRAEYVRTFTEKLLAYALGRSVEYYDLPVIRKIAAEAAADDYRWSSVIAGVVKSLPFTMAVAHESGGAVQ